MINEQKPNKANPQILVFAGSTRRDSFNKKLAALAAEDAAAAGASVTHVDLRDFPMPLYDGDLEQREGIPEHGKRLKQLMVSHSGFIIASPEYNSSFSGVLKNAIDWASREETDDEPALWAFSGKSALLMSASPGALGGLRGLFQLRMLLSNIRVLVVPEQVTVSKAHEIFDADGGMKDEKKRGAVRVACSSFVSLVGKLTKQ